MGFWEELIAYFPLILHGPHRKRHLQQFIVVAGTRLQNRCLATINGYTERPTDSPLTRHGPHIKRHVQQFFYCCVIRCRGYAFTEPTPSNDKGIHIQTHRLTGGIYEARRWDGLRCYDIQANFHKD
jgi:hypothetical protein